MKISEYHLGFIGFGHMAQGIFKAIDRSKLIPRSNILFVRRDPQKARKNEQEFGITATTLETLVQKSQILIIGVRPNQAHLILQELNRLKPESKMVISIIAGIKLASYQKYLGDKNLILRAMPNSGASVAEGMTVFTFGQATNEFRSMAHILFSCMGEVLEVPEEQTDISCALAGSGPGFVFRLIEAAARVGEKHGLTYPNALKMSAQAFAGAARLILKGEDPKTLIQQIAVPHGTTEAGFKVMAEAEIEKHFQKVFEAAANRSKTLSEEYK